MSDPKKPADVGDLKSRLGISGAAAGAPPESGAPLHPPPAMGSPVVPPPALGSRPPPAAVPPPALGLGSAVPAPVFGQKKVDVAPPPFFARRKKEKKVRRIVQEEYEDVDPIDDPRAKARTKKLAVICLAISIPAAAALFYVGKSRQSWALMDRSRSDAAVLVENLTKASSSIQAVQTKTAAALSRARESEVDSSYLDFTLEMSEQRPIKTADLDMLNYAAFDPALVDSLYAYQRLVDEIWGEMATHRGLTKTDLGALQNASGLGTPPMQPRFGVVLANLDAETLGASAAVAGNPGVDDEGNQTVDVQVRPGRRAHTMKVYDSGPFGDNLRDYVVIVDPEQSTEGGSLAAAEKSHMARYLDRLHELNELANQAATLHGELLRQLQTI